eukprot:bmy_02933T0
MPRSVRSGISLLNVQRVIKQLQPHKQKLRDTLPEPELAERVPDFLSCDSVRTRPWSGWGARQGAVMLGDTWKCEVYRIFVQGINKLHQPSKKLDFSSVVMRNGLVLPCVTFRPTHRIACILYSVQDKEDGLLAEIESGYKALALEHGNQVSEQDREVLMAVPEGDKDCHLQWVTAKEAALKSLLLLLGKAANQEIEPLSSASAKGVQQLNFSKWKEKRHLNRPRVTKEGACVKQRVKNVVENGTRNTGHPTEVLKRSQGTIYSNKKATVLKAEEDKQELYSLMEGSLSGQGSVEGFEPSDDKCLLRATDGKREISTVVSSEEVIKFQTAYSNLLRATMDGLEKRDKRSKTLKPYKCRNFYFPYWVLRFQDTNIPWMTSRCCFLSRGEWQGPILTQLLPNQPEIKLCGPNRPAFENSRDSSGWALEVLKEAISYFIILNFGQVNDSTWAYKIIFGCVQRIFHDLKRCKIREASKSVALRLLRLSTLLKSSKESWQHKKTLLPGDVIRCSHWPVKLWGEMSGLEQNYLLARVAMPWNGN